MDNIRDSRHSYLAAGKNEHGDASRCGEDGQRQEAHRIAAGRILDDSNK